MIGWDGLGVTCPICQTCKPTGAATTGENVDNDAPPVLGARSVPPHDHTLLAETSTVWIGSNLRTAGAD